ncbi:MAG TPA: DUF4270 domain-containing protein [Flavobacterium sp.]|uniref:DUF4270 domain-containing protein n=1 Tax=Flavobacterium sp. TaxID=239 RepID=UPI002CC0EB0F|nr:DUF4270 domain-containing protein [Flavobacterium sp.]HNP32883.1 DUF4270 domain-containing protein [Flavobacterium sp.]
MYKKSLLQPILFGLFTIILIASCDKDFNELGTNVVGDDHFGFTQYTGATVKAYNQKLGPIASNNLPINALGFYSNPVFGDTEANFVTQLELSTTSPVFNNTDNTLYQDLPVIDSVILDIPYFKTLKTSNSDNTNTYVLDSIFGVAPYDKDHDAETSNSKFKLSVYESNYFLRNLDPDQSLVEQQLFYTDQNALIDGNKIPVLLNNAPLTDPASGTEGTHNADGRENEHFYFDKREHKLTTYKSDGVTKQYTRYAPSMRLHLRTDVFYNKILNAPSGKLDDNFTFKNYFRGLYFKVENGNPGNMALLNFANGTIKIFYKEDLKNIKTIRNPDGTTTTVTSFTRESKSYALNLKGNCISLLKTSNENPDYLNAANNTTQEASKLYLKGGEGSMAVIDLFGTTDTKGYTLNPSYNANLPINQTSNPKYILHTTPNGVSDEIDDMIFNGWLINEANLTFYIDRDGMKSDDADAVKKQVVEPNRIYLYDLTNKKTLIDYVADGTTDGTYPKLNKYIYGGILLNTDGSGTKQIKGSDGLITNKGNKYKIRITNYLRDLITKDSTNVRLGLSVTESISNVGFSKLRTANSNSNSAPTMSVANPLGTILYGSNPSVPDDKRLKLEIWYTKPN